jgi:hypothetical protein
MGPQKGRPIDSAFVSNGEAMGQSSTANSVHAVGLPDGGAGDLRPGQRRVEVQLMESFSVIQHRLPVMRRTRWFSNTSPDEILSLILGLKFCGARGLMADSTACSEECFPDRRARSIKTFRPLGKRLGSALAGSFDVLQELIECFAGPYGTVANIRMSFSPTTPEAQGPTGSFLWQVEACQPNGPERCACWRELVNTGEIWSKGWPELTMKAGKRRVFQWGHHHHLMEKAAHRIADVLDTNSIVAASCARARLTFGL